LILDRDAKYSDAFRTVLLREGIHVIRLPPRSPQSSGASDSGSATVIAQRLDPLRSYCWTIPEYLVVQRVGQGLFREALLRRWSGRCAITGVDVPEFLRASHIKPWAHCASDAERLDPDNGLLLVANWDAAFDHGLVTFTDVGTVEWSARLPMSVRETLGMTSCSLPIGGAAMRRYLEWHRQHVFKDRS
jgi:predicted restriction endonuclease